MDKAGNRPSAANAAARAARRFDAADAASVVGFACLFAWFLVTLLWILPHSVPRDHPAAQLVPQIAFLGGMALMTLVLAGKHAYSSFRAVRARETLVAACCLFGISPDLVARFLPQVMGDMLPFEACACAAGAAASYLFLAWESVGGRVQDRVRIRASERPRPVVLVARALVAGGFVVFACALALPGQSPLFSAGALVVSGLLLAYLEARVLSGEPDLVPTAHEERNRPEDARIGVLFGMLAVCFGYAWALLALGGGLPLAIAIGAGSVLVAGYLVVGWLRGSYLTAGGLQRLCLAIVFAGLVAILFCPREMDIAGLCLIAVAWFFFRAFYGGLLMRYAVRVGTPPARYLAAGKAGSTLGMLIGWLYAFSVLRDAGADASLTASAALLAILMLTALFFLLPLASHDDAG